ncbi:MAG: universal stress protein [Opitutus sp.]|nr:universal stress protein [Opitutus sp.]
MKTILAPIDFSEVSGGVVTAASNLAHALHGRVVLLTVVQPPVITSEYAPMMENLSEIIAAGDKTAGKNLTKIAEQLQSESIPAETVQLDGAPVAHIIEQAQQCAADYIVMGSHGHSAVYDLLVGSTTHGVLRRARCPVLIVPPPKKKAERTRK